MSAAGMGTSGCRPGPSPGAASGTCNPRKFSEKIALHNQRQAEETAAFQEVMLDITSTRIQAQKERLAQNQGPCYGGSLPNVNQIGRSNPEFQGQFISDLDSTRQMRHHGLVERVQRDRRPMLSGAPYRRRRDCPTYSSTYLSPAPSLSWRRHWSPDAPADKSQSLAGVTLNRTNSDSALHTSVMNPHAGIHSSPGHALTHRNRRSMFPYPVPPIEENVLDEESLLKSWDAKKLTAPTSRPKSCEVPGINILPSPAQQSGTLLNPASLSTGGSLPDLTNLHLPSPMPSQKDELGYASLSGGGSTGNLAATLTQLGITAGGNFSLPGLSTPLPGTFSNSMLQSSLSHPNIQSSLSCHSSHDSLSSTSLQSSLSNPSLQSSLSSSPSLPSSLSNQSLHSSLSNSSLSGKSLQSAANNPSFSSGIGGSGSCSSSSSYSSLLAGQQGPSLTTSHHITSLTTSPRRRNQLSPLKLSVGTESRWHPSKQFSPTMSPTLSSITQGVALDTSKLPVDQRLPSYPYGQVQQSHLCPQQSAHPGTMMTHLQQPQQSDLQHQPQHHPQQQQHHRLQQHQQQHHLQQQNLEQHQQQRHLQQQNLEQHQQQRHLQQQNLEQHQQQRHLQQQNLEQHQQQHHLQQQNLEQHQQQHHLQQQNLEQHQQQHHLQQQNLEQHQQQHHLQQQNLEQPQLQKQQLPYQKQTKDQQQHQILQQQEQEHHQQQHLQQSALHQSAQQRLQQQHQQYPQLPSLHNASQQPQWLQFQQQQQQQSQNQLQVQAPHRGLEQQRQIPGMHRAPASSQNLLSPQRRAPESASQPGPNCGQTPTGRPPCVPNPQASMEQLLPTRLTPSASQSLPANLDLQNEASLLSALLDEPFVNLQLPGRQGQELSQQLRRFYVESPGGDQPFSQAGGSETGKDEASPMESHSTTIHQLLNQQNQNQNFTMGSHKNPNILLSGNSTPALSKDITCTLSSMPGFDGDPFGLDDPLRMDPLVLEGLGLLEDGELVLADPAVEDSFRSERFH